jgi:hypothetical protein
VEEIYSPELRIFWAAGSLINLIFFKTGRFKAMSMYNPNQPRKVI